MFSGNGSDSGRLLCAVADMVKDYSLPTTPEPSAAASSLAAAASQDEGGNAGEQDQGGNAGRRGKRGRRSNLHSLPSPLKRPRDAAAPGDYSSLGIVRGRLARSHP